MGLQLLRTSLNRILSYKRIIEIRGMIGLDSLAKLVRRKGKDGTTPHLEDTSMICTSVASGYPTQVGAQVKCLSSRLLSLGGAKALHMIITI